MTMTNLDSTPIVKIDGRVIKNTGSVELTINSNTVLNIQNIILTDGNSNAFVTNLNKRVISIGDNKITGKIYLLFNASECTVQLITDKGTFIGSVKIVKL
mgnify:CR=1 FL=1